MTAVFILIDWAGVNGLGHGQLLATESNCALTAGLVFMLRGRKALVAVSSGRRRTAPRRSARESGR